MFIIPSNSFSSCLCMVPKLKYHLYLFIYSFTGQKSLSTCSMPGTILDAENIVVNQSWISQVSRYFSQGTRVRESILSRRSFIEKATVAWHRFIWLGNLKTFWGIKKIKGEDITEKQTKVFVLCPKRKVKVSNNIKKMNDMVKCASKRD